MTLLEMEMKNPAYIDFSFTCPFCSLKIEATTDLQMWLCKACHAVFSFNTKKGVISGAQYKWKEVALPELIKAVLKNKRRRKP